MTMRRLILGCLAMVAVVLTVPVVGLLLLRSLPEQTRSQRIDLTDLLVDQTAFPTGRWVTAGPFAMQGDSQSWGDEGLNLVLRPAGQPRPPGYVDHWVYRFHNVPLAMYGQFWIERDGLLFPAHSDPGLVPAELTYNSPIADSWQIACNEYDYCTVMARYDEFISIFTAHLRTPYMRIDTLQEILRTIDVRFAEQLGKPPPVAP